jgi:hypothetical protein
LHLETTICMEESNIRICKVCLKEKERISNGKFPDGKSPCYVDAHGRQWNGRVCPECNVERAKGTMRKIRAKNA